MWVFQIGTFSNRPLGNVLAKLQQWLVKSIEVNCSHCWGFRNQAVEAKIPGEIGQNYCRWFPLWIEKGVDVGVDEWKEIKAWFFAMNWEHALWKTKEKFMRTSESGDHFQYWLQMTSKYTPWYHWTLVVCVRKIALREYLWHLLSVRDCPGYLKFLLNTQQLRIFYLQFKKWTWLVLIVCSDMIQ